MHSNVRKYGKPLFELALIHGGPGKNVDITRG